MNLAPVDAAIVVLYLTLTVLVGAWAQRRASTNLESYFLGGRRMNWVLLGMSGSGTFFDITGTMWMVSVFYVLGMRGLWEQFFWGFPFAGFVMAYKAKWAYRSGVLTGMEWLVFRYGGGAAGQAARLMTVLITLTIMVMMLGYAGTGVGKFLGEFLPGLGPYGAPLLFAITGIYVLLGGFFSVVYSDFFQTILLSFAAVYIAVTAFLGIDPEAFRSAVGDDWFSVSPVWKLPEVPSADYADPFGLLIGLWFLKGMDVLLRASGGTFDFQRFRAARNEADACKIGLAWGTTICVRWGLVIGITAYGLFVLADRGDAVDPERVLPMMLNQVLPVGVKGLVLAGLMAAFMSTFDSTLNVGASFVVNDLVKPLWKSASPKALVGCSYVATLTILLLGILVSLRTERIREIWNPINFALGAALLGPLLMSAYWWRISGWALCASGACTLPAALWIKLYTDWNELRYFPVLAGVSIVCCVAAAFAFPATPSETLKDFYLRVRPFGLWGPVRRMLADAGEDPRRPASDRYDIPVALVGTVFFVALYLAIMDAVLHNWLRIVWLSAVTLVCGTFLYYAWWRRLGLLLDKDRTDDAVEAPAGAAPVALQSE